MVERLLTVGSLTTPLEPGPQKNMVSVGSYRCFCRADIENRGLLPKSAEFALHRRSLSITIKAPRSRWTASDTEEAYQRVGDLDCSAVPPSSGRGLPSRLSTEASASARRAARAPRAAKRLHLSMRKICSNNQSHL